MYSDIEKILIPKDEIHAKVKEIAAKINEDYKGKNVIMVCILRGACVFFADLIRELDFNVAIDFMAVSSYGSGAESSGIINIKKDISEKVAGKHVIIVEDIIDSGNTLFYLKKLFLERKASSVAVCAFLDKPERRVKEIEADYCGYSIPNAFVVGYGLDYAESYRNLPEVCVLKSQVYEKH